MATPMGQWEYNRTITFKTQWAKLAYPTASYIGQTIIITGANSGVGLEAARHIVRLGAAKVILAVRDVSKGERAAADIIASTKTTKNVTEVWPLDLTSLQSIHDFAAKVNKLDRVDAVLQNAGLATGIYKTTDTGEETGIATNTIRPVLLALLLLPKLRETAKKYNIRTRLAFTGSESYFWAKLAEANIPGPLIDALNDEEVFKTNVNDRYPTSKLLQFHAVRELAARSPVTPASNVIITTVTPGLCWTGLGREIPWFAYPFFCMVMLIFARTAEVGSRALVDALKAGLGTEAHGAFLMDCEPLEKLGESVENEKGQAVAKKFTSELFGRLERISPGATRVLG